CSSDDTVTTRSLTLGSNRLVNAKWPRWLVPIWLSKPSAVRAYGAAMMPALLMSTSALSTPSANRRTDDRSCRSSWRTSTWPAICSAAFSPLRVSRTAMTTVAPCPASSRAVTDPSPLLAPVMKPVRPANDGRSAAVQSVMAENTRSLGRDNESANDRLDVGRLSGRLVGQRGDRQLDQVSPLGGRGAGGDDDPVQAVQPLAVEVVAALDHRGGEAVEGFARSVQLLEVLEQLRVGVAVLDHLGGVEIPAEPEHHESCRRVLAALGDHHRFRRDVRTAERCPARRGRNRYRQVGQGSGCHLLAGDADALQILRQGDGFFRRAGLRGGGRTGRPDRLVVRGFRSATDSRGGQRHQHTGGRAAPDRWAHRISRTASIGRANRVPFHVTTKGRSMRMG